MEQVKHLYAHFRSCLSLIVQNDSEANKLAILQPLIEQHLNDIRLDQLALQANSNEIFEHIDQTLSSIGGGPSFNTSTGSINNTFLNQNTSNGNKAITPKRLNDKSTSEVTPKTRQVISNTEKLSHLQGLQHIAQQVLSLNSLKYKLVNEYHLGKSVDSNMMMSSKTSGFGTVNAGMSADRTQPATSPAPSNRTGAPSSRVDSAVCLGPSQRQTALSGLNRPHEASNINSSEFSSPNRYPAQTPVAQGSQMDVYYQKVAQKKAAAKPPLAQNYMIDSQFSNMKADGGISALISPGRQNASTQPDEGISTLESSKFDPTASPNFFGSHNRNRSDDQLTSPRKLGTTGEDVTNYTGQEPSSVKIPIDNRWSEQTTGDDPSLAQQVKDQYFSTHASPTASLTRPSKKTS